MYESPTYEGREAENPFESAGAGENKIKEKKEKKEKKQKKKESKKERKKKAKYKGQGGKGEMRLALKIFLYFAAFTFLVILILWLIQVVFFDNIYRYLRMRDMKSCANYIAESIEDENIESGVIEASDKYDSCITVYDLSEDGKEWYDHIRTSCTVHYVMLEKNVLYRLYNDGAKRGVYFIDPSDSSSPIRRIPFGLISPRTGGDESSGGGIPSFFYGYTEGADGAEKSETSICVKSLSVNGRDYLILVDSETLPLSSTSRTLMYQLIYVTLFLLICAMVFSVIIANKVAWPFKKMTEGAALLARGKYDVNFDAGGFYEAKKLGDTLNYASRELSKLDVMQKELIANISHDLRTPLTLITGYSEMMRDIPGEMTSENMQVIIDETARLSSLVSDILELSKLTGGEQTPHFEYFSITETVEETIKRYTRLIERDNYKITFEHERDAVIFADRTRVLQVIYNLLSNAVNHTGDDMTVRVSQTVENGKVRISVTDSGEGIPPEQLPMIWERYYKVRDFHKRPKVGMGLGLAIVKNILLMHKSHFGVTSKVGAGSTFWFEFDVFENPEK